MAYNNINKVSKNELTPELRAELEREASAIQNGRMSASDKVKLNKMADDGSPASLTGENFKAGVVNAAFGETNYDSLEIATGLSSTMPIIIRQYTGTESNRYQSIKNYVNLLDPSGNSRFSGKVTAKTLESTDSTVAPMIVASSIKVSNLNSDMVDGYHASTTAAAGSIPVFDSTGVLNILNSVSFGEGINIVYNSTDKRLESSKPIYAASIATGKISSTTASFDDTYSDNAFITNLSADKIILEKGIEISYDSETFGLCIGLASGVTV